MRTPTILVLLVALTAGVATAQVCDLVELTTTSAPGSLSQPALLGTAAYVAGGSAGIVVFDLSQPTNPVVTGSVATAGDASDILVDYFASRLVVANGGGGVGTYTIDTEGNPVADAGVTLGETIVSVAASSSQLVAGSQEGTLYTLSAGNESITSEGSLALGGPVLGLVQNGSRVYCALGDAGLALVDVSNRTSPEVVTTVDLGGPVLSVAREGSRLFCGVDGVGLVSVLIADGTLLPAGSLTLVAAPTRLVAWGGRVFMAGPELGAAEADASLGSDLLLLSRLDLSDSGGILLSGNSLYIGRGSQGLAVVDATDCAQSGVLPTSRYIPAAARATGAANTYWVTDLAIANLTGSVATCNIAYLAKNEENSSPVNLSLVLEAGRQMLVHDVFSTLFGLDAANGGLRITASHPDVKSTSRTYNAAGADGTYGQFIPAQPREQALEPGVVGSLLQLQENDGYRTNVGLLNLTENTIQLEVDLYLGSGDLVGVRNETLLPYEMAQVDHIFTTVGADTVDSGFVTVKVVTSGGRALAYASVVDNESGDPIFVPAQTLSLGTPFG